MMNEIVCSICGCTIMENFTHTLVCARCGTLVLFLGDEENGKKEDCREVSGVRKNEG